MKRAKRIFAIMLKAMGLQAGVALIISIIWIFIQIGNRTQSVGIKPLGIAFCNAFFMLGILCAAIAIVKIWWDFFWLKRDLSKDITAQITYENSETSLGASHDADAAKENRLIVTREKTWELAFIVLGVVDFAISFALSMALISY